MSNSKKSLLNENTIRRFMKLAEIDNLSNGFVEGLVESTSSVEEGAMHYQRDDEPLDTGSEEEGLSGLGDSEESGDVAKEMAKAMADEMPAEEETDVVITDEEASVLIGVLEKLTAAHGGGAEEPDELDMSAPAEMVDVDLSDDEEAVELAEKKEAQPANEGLQQQAVYRAALKQEVMRRVTARIHQERQKDAIADQLSERILQRIKSQPKK